MLTFPVTQLLDISGFVAIVTCSVILIFIQVTSSLKLVLFQTSL